MSMCSPEPELFFFLFFIHLYHIRRIRGIDARIYIYIDTYSRSFQIIYNPMAPHLNTRNARGDIQRPPARAPARSPAPADDPVALARVRQIEQQMQFEAEDCEARQTREDAESAARIAAVTALVADRNQHHGPTKR
jgi:hypothetical protein